MAKGGTPTFRLRLAQVILGSKAKAYIPALNPNGGLIVPGAGGRLQGYETKQEQLEALVGWVFTANSAIADPCAAVELKLYQKQSNGKKVEVADHELMALLEGPNALHTGEQLLQLHYTYMNMCGESYIYMRDRNGGDFIPANLPLSPKFCVNGCH